MKRPMNRIATALVPLALAAACGTTPSSPSGAAITPAASSPAPLPSSVSPSAPASSPPTPTATVTQSTGSSDLAPPTGTKQVEVKRAPARPPLVKGVRLAAHQGYDRVVIDLLGARTGYTVGWVKQLIEDGSGEPVDIKGGAYLQATLTPASAHTEDGKPTWGRTPMFQPDLGNVTGVVRIGDFEGVVTVAIVLRHRAGFRVSEQSNPSRLVIDVAH
ncbi:AMIN-like domain-containing (lipo)protein [Sphaerisporangium viridialbum]|uniref:AMIN-like domain-containing (lipo)protein n=1 Tax=Sphaerisporangium viridialbum TaxID=46189 RepID=UPI003C725150